MQFAKFLNKMYMQRIYNYIIKLSWNNLRVIFWISRFKDINLNILELYINALSLININVICAKTVRKIKLFVQKY